MQAFFRAITLVCLVLIAIPAWSEVCDVDTDGDIDRSDIQLIAAARNQPAGVDDPRDADGDGTITVTDSRTCVRMCTLSRCAIPEPDGSLIWDEGNWDEEDWE